jgi:hypothetical protein
MSRETNNAFAGWGWVAIAVGVALIGGLIYGQVQREKREIESKIQVQHQVDEFNEQVKKKEREAGDRALERLMNR